MANSLVGFSSRALALCLLCGALLLLCPRAADAAPQTKINASDGVAGDRFGQAAFSISGNYAVVGARYRSDAGLHSGAAYTFANTSGNTWVQQAKLTSSDAAADEEFGYATSLSGNLCLVSCHRDGSGGSTAGAAYIFANTSGSTWTQQAKLMASDATSGDEFSYSVSLSGNIAAVGAYKDDDQGTDSGSAYIFANTSGNTWVQQAKLHGSQIVAGDIFGISMSISGNKVIAGAQLADDGVSTDIGAAYVFTNTSGNTWVQDAILTASDHVLNDTFGHSVCLEGNVAIVGATAQDPVGTDSGAAYIFANTSGNTWVQQAKLTASDAASGDWFGYSVWISGNVAIVGALFDDDNGTDSGSTYVFVNTSGNTWIEKAKIKASDAATLDQFGEAATLSGNTVMISSPLDDDLGTDSGSAYIFNLASGNSLAMTSPGADFTTGGNTTLTLQVRDMLDRLVTSDSTTQITFTPTSSGNIVGVVTGTGDGSYGVAGGAETVTVASGVATVRLSNSVAQTFQVAITNNAGLTNPTNDSIAVTATPSSITMSFSSLPSAQGWTYVNNESPSRAEATVFSVDGTKLTQNTLSQPNSYVYAYYNAFNPALPFTISCTAKIISQSGTTNQLGFVIAAQTGTEQHGIALAQGGIYDASGTATVITSTIDTTQAHVYRVEVTPGVGFNVLVDNTSLGTFSALSATGNAYLALGDWSSFSQAQADVTAYAFTQGSNSLLFRTPAGGETWFGTQTIAWTTSGSWPSTATVDIQYTTNAWVSTGTVASGINVHTGSYSWNTAAVGDGSSYLLRLTSGGVAYGTSAGSFTVANSIGSITWQENFESYAAGSDLNGQGGWSGGKVFVNNGTGLSSKVADGLTDPGTGVQVYLRRSISLDATKINVLTFDVYAKTSNPMTHASAILLEDATSTNGKVFWGFYADRYGAGNQRPDGHWMRFATLETSTADGYYNVMGGSGNNVKMSIVVDPLKLRTYGTALLEGQQYVSDHRSITLTTVNSITTVGMIQDFRNQTPTRGAEYDNFILYTTDPLSFISPASGSTLSGTQTISWSTAGSWNSSDTVNVEATTNAWTTSTTIASGINVHTGSYSWNTATLGDSASYLLRLTSGGVAYGTSAGAFTVANNLGTILWQENFESYAAGSDLSGQGGWTGNTVLVNNGTGLSSKVADGLTDPGTGIQARLYRSISIDATKINVLTFNAYAKTSNPMTHATGLFFRGTANTSDSMNRIMGWQFDADSNGLPQTPNGHWCRFSTYDTSYYDVLGGSGNNLQMTVVLDPLKLKTYGVASFAGQQYVSDHRTIAMTTISSINSVIMYQDFRNQTPTRGAEYDNFILYTTDPLSFISPAAGSTLSGTQTISWSTAGSWNSSDTVSVEATTNAWTTSTTIASGINVHTGSYSWNTTAAGNSSSYLLRLTSGGIAYGTSAGAFTVQNVAAISTPPTSPTLSVASSSFNFAFAVTVTGDGRSTIYYTLDGTNPTTSSASIASGSTLTIPASTTVLKIMAVDAVGNATSVATYTYTYASPLFITTPASGNTYWGTLPIVWTTSGGWSNTSQVDIQYTSSNWSSPGVLTRNLSVHALSYNWDTTKDADGSAYAIRFSSGSTVYTTSGNFALNNSETGPLRLARDFKITVGSTVRLWTKGGTRPFTAAVTPETVIKLVGLSSGPVFRGLAEGSFSITITDAGGQKLTVQGSVLPAVKATGQVSLQAVNSPLDFRLVSFPFHNPAGDAPGLLDILRPSLGDMKETNFLIYAWPGGGATDYSILGSGTDPVGPGQGYWMGVVQGKSVSLSAPGPVPGEVVEVSLKSGWNLVGNPYALALSTDDIYVTTNAGSTRVKDGAQKEVGHYLWYIESGLTEYHALNYLAVMQAAWLYVARAEGATIVFASSTTSSSSKALSKVDGTPRSQLKLSADEPQPPEPPTALGNSRPASGGGGCWLLSLP